MTAQTITRTSVMAIRRMKPAKGRGLCGVEWSGRRRAAKVMMLMSVGSN